MKATVTAPVSDFKRFETRSRLTRDNRAFQVRASQARDAPQVIAAINTVCAEELWLLTDHYVPTLQWERVLYEPNNYANYLLLVAQVAGEIVGWCRVFPYEFGDKSRHVADLGIGVIKAWRDQGIGTALTRRAIEWAKDTGFEKVTLSVFPTNVRALHVFEKTGFVRTGVRHRQVRIGTEYVDEILMERFL